MEILQLDVKNTNNSMGSIFIGQTVCIHAYTYECMFVCMEDLILGDSGKTEKGAGGRVWVGEDKYAEKNKLPIKNQHFWKY